MIPEIAKLALVVAWLAVFIACALVTYSYRRDPRFIHVVTLGVASVLGLGQIVTGLFEYKIGPHSWRFWNAIVVSLLTVYGLYHLIGPQIGIILFRNKDRDSIMDRLSNDD